MFTFSFDFDGNNYEASCHEIPPPPDKQYHITVDDEHLRFAYGDIQIIKVADGGWEYGVSPQPKGREFMSAVVKGLKNALDVQLDY